MIQLAFKRWLPAVALFPLLPLALQAATLPSPFLFSTDINQPSGVSLQVKTPQSGMTLYTKSPQSSVWQTPYGTQTLSDGTERIWYLRFDYDTAVGYQNQSVLCMGEIRNGQWVIPPVR